MFSSSSRQAEFDQKLEDLKAEIAQVRRQIEAVGQRLVDAPLTAAAPADDRTERLEQRLEGLAAEVSAAQKRLEERLEERLEAFHKSLAPQSDEPVPRRWWQGQKEEDELDLGLQYASPASGAPVQESPYWQTEETPAVAPVDDSNLSVPERLERIIQQLVMDAPADVAELIGSSAAAVSDVAMSYRNAASPGQDGTVEVVVRVRVPRDGDVAQRLDEAYAAEKARVLPLVAESEEERTQRLLTVIRRDVPALVDICDGARRQLDSTGPFFGQLDHHLDLLLRICDLESIEPHHGQVYDPGEHNALDLVETDDPALKDHVESCRYRGYKHHDELLKKAGVVIYR